MVDIVVTGSNGYIGKNIIRELKREDKDFLAVDISNDDLLDDINKVNCNIFSDENLYNKLGSPKSLLHLAWKDGFIHNSTSHMSDLSNHYNFLRKMIESGVKQITILGTMHEIGFYEGEVDENTPCNPLSQYGVAKNALRKSIELLCLEHKVTFQWIRVFYIYSNDTYSNSIFSKILKANQEGKKDFPFTSGQNMYDFISVSKLSKQIVAVINQDKINGIINCCSGKPVSLADKVEEFIKENDLSIVLNYGAFPEREYDSKAIWGNSSKINKILEDN